MVNLISLTMAGPDRCEQFTWLLIEHPVLVVVLIQACVPDIL